MPASSNPLLISFLFALDTEQGHLFEYNKSVGMAVRAIGWEHAAAVRAAARVSETPPGWSFCLGRKETTFQRGLLVKVEKLVRLFTSLSAYLRRQASQDRAVILFLEWFDLVHLAPFCLALATIPRRQQFWVWMLYRLAPPGGHRGWPLHIVHVWIKFLLGADRLVLLSDSELVAHAIRSVFKQPTQVVPIPHTAHTDNSDVRQPAWEQSLERAGQVVCWLPGRAIPAKGLEVVRYLSHQVHPEADRLILVVSECSQLAHQPGGCAVITVPDVLPRAHYWGWLLTADIVLLPYDPQIYKERTSGGFAEAITAGKIPVVMAGTWMAYELAKYQLRELILDWQSPTLVQELLRLPTDVVIQQKLAWMRHAYKQFHSLAGFGEALQRVWEQRPITSTVYISSEPS